MNRYLKRILSEQCHRANTTFRDQNFTKKEWFRKHTWTMKQEMKFRDWLKKYLMTNSKARHAVMNHPINSSKHIDRFISWWILDYGWTISDYDKETNI